MISALITGRVIGTPSTGVTKTNKPYGRLALSCDAGGERPLTISVMVFDERSIELLGEIRRGDIVSAQGQLQESSYTAKTGEVKSGFTLAFSRLMVTPPKREKRQSLPATAQQTPATPAQSSYRAAAHAQRDFDADLGSDLPW